MSDLKDLQNNMNINNDNINMEHFNRNNINDLNKKEMVGGINYMYPQTKTGYDHYYDINQHMMLEYPKKNIMMDEHKTDNESDNKIKNLVDEITNNIDNMENIYENYEQNNVDKNDENINKKYKKKNKNNEKNEKNEREILMEKWRDPMIIFIIYIILSLPSIQSFIGKYIKQINPNPITCDVSMYGVIIYGIILSISYFIVKNKILSVYDH